MFWEYTVKRGFKHVGTDDILDPPQSELGNDTAEPFKNFVYLYIDRQPEQNQPKQHQQLSPSPESTLATADHLTQDEATD